LAIAFTHRAQLFSTNNVASYATSGTYTPAANSLIVVFVINSLAASPLDPTSVTGHGLSFAQISLSGRTFDTTHTLSVWVVNAGASPTSAAVTADFNSVNQTGCVIIETEITGWDTGGTASAAIVQNPTQTGSDLSMEMNTLASASAADNRPITFGGIARNSSLTVDADWTLGFSSSFNSPATGGGSAFRTDAFDTSMTFTASGNNAWRTVGLEIKAAAAGVSLTPGEAAALLVGQGTSLGLGIGLPCEI
jgi:hypothetical protein